MFFLLSSANSWAVAEFKEIPQFTLSGEATIFAPSDHMDVSLGIVTEGDTSSQALHQNEQHTREILAALQALGLEETEYKTGRFDIRPIYQKLPEGSEGERSVKIHHYEVVNMIQVKTQKIHLVNKMIEAAVAGGANQIGRVNFSLSDPHVYRAKAIKEAAENALFDATQLAIAMGFTLKRILSVSLNQWQQWPMMFKESEGGGHRHEGRGQEMIQPGEAEIHVTVNVTFEIASF